MHLVLEMTEHGAYILTFIVGVAFWLAIICVIALAVVANKLIDELISGDEDDKDDTDGDPDMDDNDPVPRQ